MKINARLDESLTEKFDYISKTTGKNTSTIVREAIELYYKQICKHSNNAQAILEKNHFIACANAETDLSENYKSYLSLSGKYDYC